MKTHKYKSVGSILFTNMFFILWYVALAKPIRILTSSSQSRLSYKIGPRTLNVCCRSSRLLAGIVILSTLRILLMLMTFIPLYLALLFFGSLCSSIRCRFSSFIHCLTFVLIVCVFVYVFFFSFIQMSLRLASNSVWFSCSSIRCRISSFIHGLSVVLTFWSRTVCVSVDLSSFSLLQTSLVLASNSGWFSCFWFDFNFSLDLD